MVQQMQIEDPIEWKDHLEDHLSVACRYSCYPNNDEVVAFLSLLIQIFLIKKERDKQIKKYAFMLCS